MHFTYKCIVLIIMLSTFFSSFANVWNGESDTSWYSADKTEFYISTAEQLKGLSDLVNQENITFDNCQIILDDDIDLNNIQWTPIGFNNWHSFNGEFNGNNHIITNMMIENDQCSSNYIGLFGYASGTIKNVILSGKIILNDTYTSSFINIGTLCGYANTITDCYCDVNMRIYGKSLQNLSIGGVAASVSNMSRVLTTGEITTVNMGEISGSLGGLVYHAGTIDQCSVYTIIRLGIWNDNTSIAGIVDNCDKISNCIFNGKLQIHHNYGGGYVSGIARSSKNIENVIFTPSEWYVNLEFDQFFLYDLYVGGFCGSLGSSFIEQCIGAYYTTNLNSTSQIGQEISLESLKSGEILEGYDPLIWKFQKDYIPAIKSTSRILLNHTSLNLIEGETSMLEASILPENSSDNSIIWISNDESIATVESNGLVHALKSGSTTITAFSPSGITASCEINVVAKTIVATDIKLDSSSVELTIGDTYALYASIYPENSSDKSIIWTSSNDNVASVSGDGIVRGLNIGNAIITATTSNGLSASCYVKVNPIFVESIAISPSTIEAEEGSEIQLTATIIPDNATIKELDWISSNPSIAIVDATGFVKIISPGVATITAKATDGSNIEATCEVTGLSGVEEILSDGKVWNLYSTNGILLHRKVNMDDIKKFPSAIYILSDGTVTIKFIKK